jgi:hypothetical protein
MRTIGYDLSCPFEGIVTNTLSYSHHETLLDSKSSMPGSSHLTAGEKSKAILR